MFACLDLERKSSFLDRHSLTGTAKRKEMDSEK